MDYVTAIAVGKVIAKLTVVGWEAYCDANRENVDAFSLEKIQALRDDHHSTEQILADNGVEFWTDESA